MNRAYQGASVIELQDDELNELIVRSSGDERRDAFAELWQRKRVILLSRAYDLTGDWARSEEVVAEAGAKTWQALSSGKGPTSSVLGYLLTAVQSEAGRTTAIERVTDAVDDAALAVFADPRDAAIAELRDEQDLLGRAFGSLSEDHQRVLALMIVEEQTTAQAAAALGLSESATTSLAHRARESLRSAYLEQYVDRAPKHCKRAAGVLARYVRGTLSASASATLESHLGSCLPCKRQVARLRGINTSLRVLLGPVAGGAALGAALQLLGSGTTEASAAVSPVLFRVAAGIASAALIAGGVWLLISSGQEQSSADPTAPRTTEAPASPPPPPSPSPSPTASTRPTPTPSPAPGAGDEDEDEDEDDTTRYWVDVDKKDTH